MTSYVVHVVSHSKHNRTERANLPKNPRKRQYVGDAQMRVVRGRPIVVSEEYLQKNLESLRKQAAAHCIEVRTPDGRRVDLATMQIEAAPPVQPLPNMPLDSLANDKNPVYPPGWVFVPPYVSDDQTVPQLVGEGQQPALMKEALEDANGRPTSPGPLEIEEPAAGESEPLPVDDDLDKVIAQAQADASMEDDGAPSPVDDEDEGTEDDENSDKGPTEPVEASPPATPKRKKNK